MARAYRSYHYHIVKSAVSPLLRDVFFVDFAYREGAIAGQPRRSYMEDIRDFAVNQFTNRNSPRHGFNLPMRNVLKPSRTADLA